MRALVMRGHGDISQLAVAEVADPAIAGAGDVLIRIRAAALNHLDVWTLEGLPGLTLRFPHVLGGDGAGEVAAVGERVQSVRPGDRVMFNPGISCYRCEWCLAGEHSLCITYRILGEHLPGTIAGYVVVPEQNVALIPTPPPPVTPITWPEAAAFSLVTLTAWRMLMNRARLRAGETVLIWGIGGGVSAAALRIARLAGAFVIATSSSDAKLAWAKQAGADAVLNHRQADVAKEARALTGKRGVDVVVEHVGEATWEQSLRCLARKGRVVVCGATTGPHVAVDLRRTFWYQHEILGSTMGNADEYRHIVRLLGRGELRPLVDRAYPLDQAIDAFERLASGEHMGKVVVEVP